MTKHEALRDLSAVLRDSPFQLPRVEAGPAPLSPARQYANPNPAAAPSSRLGTLLSQLSPSAGVSGAYGGSLLDGLLAATGRSATTSTGGIGGLLGGASRAVSPVVSGLLGLFGVGGKTASPPLPLYSAPQRLQLQSGVQGGRVTAADVNQSGLSRAGAGGGQPQVTLHIQAMDTQSILNRSSDIAQAVRQAMLQSHPINDVVADL